MRNRNWFVILTAALLCCGLAATVFADGPRRGARMGDASAVRVDEASVSIPVTVDLGDTMLGDRQAMVGAYVVRVEFDPERVEFVEAIAGNDFPGAPVATSPERANHKGVVKINAARAGEEGPGGVVNLTNVRFRILAPGGEESIRPTIESLASTLMRDEGGAVIGALEIPVDSSGRRPVRRAEDN